MAPVHLRVFSCLQLLCRNAVHFRISGFEGVVCFPMGMSLCMRLVIGFFFKICFIFFTNLLLFSFVSVEYHAKPECMKGTDSSILK